MHSIFLPRAMIKIDDPILYFLWGFFYLCVVCMLYDYCIITCNDPADTLLLSADEVKSFERKRDDFNVRH